MPYFTDSQMNILPRLPTYLKLDASFTTAVKNPVSLFNLWLLFFFDGV